VHVVLGAGQPGGGDVLEGLKRTSMNLAAVAWSTVHHVLDFHYTKLLLIIPQSAEFQISMCRVITSSERESRVIDHKLRCYGLTEVFFFLQNVKGNFEYKPDGHKKRSCRHIEVSCSPCPPWHTECFCFIMPKKESMVVNQSPLANVIRERLAHSWNWNGISRISSPFTVELHGPHGSS